MTHIYFYRLMFHCSLVASPVASHFYWCTVLVCSTCAYMQHMEQDGKAGDSAKYYYSLFQLRSNFCMVHAMNIFHMPFT